MTTTNDPNPHILNAKDCIRSLFEAETNDWLLARAQTEALLAIAFEMRTANLLAALPFLDQRMTDSIFTDRLLPTTP